MVERILTTGERSMAQTIFGSSINYDEVRIHNGKHNPLQGDDTIVTPNGEIYYPSDHYSNDFSLEPDSEKALFIHEMTHVLQEHQGMNVILERIIDGSNYNYDPIFHDTRFHELPMEAQAEFLGDLYRKRNDIPVNPNKKGGILEDPSRNVGDYEDVLPMDLPESNGNVPLEYPDQPDIDIPPILPAWIPQAMEPIEQTSGANIQYGNSSLVIDVDRSGTIDLVNVANSDIRFDFWQDGSIGGGTDNAVERVFFHE